MASGATPAAVKVRLVVPAAAVLRALYDPAPTGGDSASGPCAQPVRPRCGGEDLRPVSPGAAGGGERTIAASSPSLWSQLHPQRAVEVSVQGIIVRWELWPEEGTSSEDCNKFPWGFDALLPG
ncbi:hypothetical protein J1605_013807 [Eschrichtius robustus]|uniref:Uncharacterized protein n=1 Tax=Eschrichtius robustus TaxID=9764 RepID=A0AB34GHM7_ESCRO|nr:hypothetical protein J1605_013807 [Eschrichtius robustus]